MSKNLAFVATDSRDYDLSRVTIVIPTFGRPQFVERQIEYWSDSHARVVILDGSKEKITRDRFPLNITYLHQTDGFLQRLRTATEIVNTEFVALLGDDEFFLKSGIQDAVRYLDTNIKVIGCVGRCLYFFVDQGRFLVSHAYRDWKPFSSHIDDLPLRLDADLPPNETHMAMYGIYRREVWNKMFSRAYEVQFSCGYVYERLLNLQRTTLGKTEIIESLLWLRSKENAPVIHSDIPRTLGRDFVSWATLPEFVDEALEYKKIALNILIEGGLNQVQATEAVHRFFSGGVERQSAKEKNSRKKLLPRIGRALINYSPRQIRLFCKRHIPARCLRFTGWEGHEISVALQSLKQLGTKFDETEIDWIVQAALKSHNAATNLAS